MELLKKFQREQALEQARLLAGDGERVAEVAKLALHLEDEITHLHQLLRKTEHYLRGGQDSSSHAHLLNELQHYRDRYERLTFSEEPPI